MSRGYLIAQVTVTDPEACARYAKAAGDLLKALDARTLFDPNTATVVEGAPGTRTVIVEFDSLDRAKGFWDSNEDQEAKALRLDAAEADVILVGGLE